MSKSGDPSPSSPKKTSANKKASESKEKIAARRKKFQNRSEDGSCQKKLCQGCRSGCGKGLRQAHCGKKGPGKESASGFCLQEGGAGRQKDSGKGA